jgi:hypothetical protein
VGAYALGASISIQKNYEDRLAQYLVLLHATTEHSLSTKYAIYSAFLNQHETYGDDLWKADPLLYYLIKFAETDIHLACARLLENRRNSERSIFAFIDFCITNRLAISWKTGNPPESILFSQKQKLEGYRDTISRIMARRDKYFAHLDKEYFSNPSRIFSDYPLHEGDVMALIRCIIDIFGEHENGLNPGTASFNLSEFFVISVDNMVRNLRTGRRLNFPET